MPELHALPASHAEALPPRAGTLYDPFRAGSTLRPAGMPHRAKTG